MSVAAASTTLSPLDLGGSRPVLPIADHCARVDRLGRDQDPHGQPLLVRLRPLVPVPIRPVPDPRVAPVAVLPVWAAPGLPLWVPVVDRCPGWVLVLLPCRPDGVVGWVRTDDRVEQVHHHTLLVVDTRTRLVTLQRLGDRRTWVAGVGKPGRPTPCGRTFILGPVEPARGVVDLALVLAAHAPTHLRHGAGLDAVGVHAWPGVEHHPPATDGSVIVPAAAMTVLTSAAPPGTPVLIH
ncbi:ErfK/YbiS/YcfS/YnhG [Alloactinosynnema sp. L-07]|uniref:L,D-transpeptidase n=1 Tax=Alloactinosynnema sp. L-07 TaxID=1653480 RepID=UPI00065F0775|nr:L,D-transpeptidase [Alloactinosynnema sp. L-07]CRK57011.1 ErfK/YbiS/YcfS/YnhG [Alloactinosynnema sp. L-07]